MKMRSVLAFLVWLFSFWTWKGLFLRWVKTPPIRPPSGEAAGAEQLHSEEGQQESKFALFLSSLPEDERRCRFLRFDESEVYLSFGPESTYFATDYLQTGYSEILAAVASSSFVFHESVFLELVEDDSIEHFEGMIDALRQSGTDCRYLSLVFRRGSAIRFARCASSWLLGNTGLQVLHLYFLDCPELLGKEWVAVFMAVVALPDNLRILKSFSMNAPKLDDEGMELLIKLLTGPHSVLERVVFSYVKSDAQLEHISGMLASSKSLKSLTVRYDYRGVKHAFPRGYTNIAAALRSNRSLETLTCELSCSMELTVLLDPLVPKNTNLQHNTTLTRLELEGTIGGKEGIETLVDMLRTNTSLLGLSFLGLDEFCPSDTQAIENVLAVLEALKTNKSLKKISFGECGAVGGYKVLGAMMDMIFENQRIEFIYLGGTGLLSSGDAEYVDSALSKRRKMKLWDVVQGMANENPTSGRVFLCGEPYAGKTRLRMSMKQLREFQKEDEIQTNSKIGKRKMILKVFKGSKVLKVPQEELLFERTRGIEVDNVLCNGIGITIWNMVGQTDYHSFHELVMLNLSAGGNSSLFLLMCNLIERSNPSKRRSPSDIKFEIETWLRFIASNTRRSLSYRPHMSIVMTHFDYWKDDHAFASRIEDVVVELKSLFQEVLELDEDKFVFKVDGTDVSNAREVFDFMKFHLKQLLGRLPKTISACEKVQCRIVQWNADKSKQPMLKWDEFCVSLCKEVEELNDVDDELAKRRKEFVAISLNDGGHIIYNAEHGVVITNPHWFCHQIMGQFFHLFAHKGRELEMVSPNGTISIDHVKHFILELIKGQGDIERKFDDILDVMKKLHICYEQDANHIMIPSTLEDTHQSLSWSIDDKSTSFTYVGRRLACKDGIKTMLILGFFTRLQVSFFKTLHDNNDQVTYELLRDVIKFISNGIHVIIQFNHGDIDILLRSHQCQDKMLEFLENKIVRHIKHLQTDPTLGCPGVLLEEYILRPACVQKLTNSKHRKNQYVHVKDLEVEVIKSGVDATHNWKSCEGLGIGCDKVKALLGGLAWRNLLERRARDLQEFHKRIQSLSTLTPIDPSNCNEESSDLTTTSLWQMPQRLLFAPLDAKLDKIIRVQNENQKEVMSKFDDVMQLIQNLENCIKKMEGELLHEVCSRIDDLMAFSMEMQKSQIPKLAYLCEIGKRELLTRLVPGLEKLQLHLMCENIHGLHVVANQKGCMVNFGTEHTRRFLVMLDWGLKIATILTKIGAHVACGMGGMIPDFSDGGSFVALILDTPGLLDHRIPMPTLESLQDNVEKAPKITMEERSKAENWVRDFLEPKCKNRGEFYEKFKLKKVIYRGGSESVAWICDACTISQCHQIDELY